MIHSRKYYMYICYYITITVSLSCVKYKNKIKMQKVVCKTASIPHSCKIKIKIKMCGKRHKMKRKCSPNAGKNVKMMSRIREACKAKLGEMQRPKTEKYVRNRMEGQAMQRRVSKSFPVCLPKA